MAVATDTVTTTITLPTTSPSLTSGPVAIAFTPDSAKAYVSNFIDGTVSVIDVTTDTIITTVTTVGPTPPGTGNWGISITPDGSKVYTGNPSYQGNTVSVIDVATDTVYAVVYVGIGPLAFGQFISSVSNPLPPPGSSVLISNWW